MLEQVRPGLRGPRSQQAPEELRPAPSSLVGDFLQVPDPMFLLLAPEATGEPAERCPALSFGWYILCLCHTSLCDPHEMGDSQELRIMGTKDATVTWPGGWCCLPCHSPLPHTPACPPSLLLELTRAGLLGGFVAHSRRLPKLPDSGARATGHRPWFSVEPVRRGHRCEGQDGPYCLDTGHLTASVVLGSGWKGEDKMRLLRTSA